MELVARILTVLCWLGVGLLLLLLFRIAHFYQATSGQSTRYRLFLLPLALFLLSGLRYAIAGDFAGDLIGDSLQILGGACLIALGMSLLRMMTGGRR